MEGVASGSSGSSTVIATIEVPAGETWLVAAICQVSAASNLSSSYLPDLHLGGVGKSRVEPDGTHGLATTATEPISFSIKRNYTQKSDSFTGHVYTVKL